MLDFSIVVLLMIPNNILSPEEMKKPRTVAELGAWVLKVHDEFTRAKEPRSFLRQKKGLSKQFYEEVWPLLRFAQAKYGNDSLTKLVLVIGSQQYDAIVTKVDSTEYKVEITFAKDGYEEFHKMKLLERDGHVSVFGTLDITGTKNKGYSYRMNDGACSLDEIFEKYLSAIIRAFEAKSNCTYEDVNTLIIGFDDFMLFLDDEDSATFTRMILDAAMSINCSFSDVWIVGMSGKFYVRL